MNITPINISPDVITRPTQSRQPVDTGLTAQTIGQSSTPNRNDHQKTAVKTIIDAEYVDINQPIRRPPVHDSPNWRALFVESDKEMMSKGHQSSETDPRMQQMIARYNEHSVDPPVPGSYLNVKV